MIEKSDLTEKQKKPLTPKQQKALADINAALDAIKTNIGKFHEDTSEGKPDRELILYIRDKHSNPWRKQTEDIEGDVDEMRVINT